MDLNAKINVHNKFEVTVYDKDSGRVKQTAYAENIVLDAMYTQLCNFYGFFNGIAFGTGTGTLAASRTALFSYLGWKHMNAAGCGTIEEIKTFPVMSRKRKITLQPEDHVGATITEVGIAVSSNKADTDMYFSKVVTHALLDTPIVKTATDIVVIEATIYFNFGEWETGFYNGQVRWFYTASGNQLVTYLFGGSFGSGFKVGTEPIFTLSSSEGQLGSAPTSFTADIPNKKATTPVTRFSAATANGKIRNFALDSVFSAILPIMGVFENYAITGEQLGVGDGVATGFNFKWDNIDSVNKVYLNGVETTGYALEKKINRTRFYLFSGGPMPASSAQDGVALVGDSGYLGIRCANYLDIFSRKDDVFMSENRVNLPYNVNGKGLYFSPDGTYLVLPLSNSPYISILKRNGVNYTEIAPPNILPTMSATGVAFSPDGTYMVIAHSLSPFITIYKRNGDVFTKLDDPTILPSSANQVIFSPDGTYLVVGGTSTKYLTFYKRNGDVFTKLSEPADLPSYSIMDLSFSPDGVFLAAAIYNSPYLYVYKRIGDVFTRITDIDVLPNYRGRFVKFSPDGKYLVAGFQSSSSGVYVYERNGDTLTCCTDFPLLNYSTGPEDAEFSSDSQYLIIGGTTRAPIVVIKIDSTTPAQDHNIEFTTPPDAGVVITADYTIDYIPKDANHVLDLSATIQWG